MIEKHALRAKISDLKRKNFLYQRQIVSALRSIGTGAKFLHFVCIKCKHFFHAFLDSIFQFNSHFSEKFTIWHH